MPESVQNASTRRQLGGDAAAPGAGAAARLPGHLLGKLATPPAHPLATAGEVLLLPLLAVALGYVWTPEDPLQIHGPFPWLWLAPLLLALRYGPLAGLGGAAVLLAAWFALDTGRAEPFPQMYFLGGLILVLVAGEFASFWQTRTRRAEAVQAYLDQRLEHLVRQHYVLRLSHDRLGRELIGRPMSMRDALGNLRQAEDGEQGLLRLLAQYCQIDSAALHPVANDVVAAGARAQIGAYDGLHADDPLVRRALETRKLHHISQAVTAGQDSRYLIAAPLLDLAGDAYALLLVQGMPFFGLNEENLQTLQLLLGYYTDGLLAETLAQPIVQAFPDCPQTFAFELQRLAHIRASAQVPSTVVALELRENAIAHDLPQQILRQKRELDEAWLIKTPGRQVLAMLLPLGDDSAAEGYIARLENWIRQKGDASLADAGVFAHTLPLDADAPERTVRHIQAIAHAA